MTTNIFQGDPRLFITPDGTEIAFVGGQPIMDGGIENAILISLFTEKGWAGNVFARTDAQKIGSDFLKSTRQSITLQSINDMRSSAEKALDDPLFGRALVTVDNPTSNNIEINILVQPPGQDVQQLLLSRYSDNWQLQALSPASGRV